MKLFGEITKVEAQDDGSIKVVGIASTGAVDEAEERVLPQAMKAALPAYMRFGALREMHGMSAAGATLSAEVGEDGATRIEALVVDPVAVRKVQLGVYKGFSIGGKVVERDPADRRVITKLKLNEISLVDRPCNPEAVIDMWKAGAAPAPTNAEVIARAIAMASEAGKPGHTEFVMKAREALLAETAPDDGDDGSDASAPAERHDERAIKVGARNSAVDLARIQAAHDLLVALGACCDGHGQDNADAAEPDNGDDESEPQDAEDDVLAGATIHDLIKALAENRPLDAVTPHIAALERAVADLENRLEALAAQPAPPKAFAGLARAVSKAEDARPGGAPDAETLRKYFASLPPEERGQLELKAALRKPISLGR